jgi:hypothetical protein
MPESLAHCRGPSGLARLFCCFEKRDELPFSDTVGTDEFVVSSTRDVFGENVRTELGSRIPIVRQRV